MLKEIEMNKFIMVVMVMVVGFSQNITASEEAWDSGGNLHNALAERWRNSSARNQFATSADFAASISSVKRKVKASGSIDTLKYYTKELNDCINTAISTESNHAVVKDVAAMCMVLLHW